MITVVVVVVVVSLIEIVVNVVFSSARITTFCYMITFAIVTSITTVPLMLAAGTNVVLFDSSLSLWDLWDP